jgi:NitT/TauT family transport system ATP-binding protein
MATNAQQSNGASGPILEVRHLKKVFTAKSRTVEAIGDISASVEAGELTCIVGPSGAGKTTLLRCLAGLLEPTAGEVIFEGRPVQGPPRGMAVVFQEYSRSLFPWLTVRQNVELPLVDKRLSRDARRRLVDESLVAVGLADVDGAHPWQLSGGMQQRVAIARAVSYEPHVLLMDEPFAAVDAQTRADLEDLVRKLWQSLGVTVLFVTHDIEEAVYLGQRVMVLSLSPTEILADVAIDLPTERTQITTRSLPRFVELRAQIYRLIQQAKQGARPAVFRDTH